MQSSLLNSILEDKNLSEIPNFRYVFSGVYLFLWGCITIESFEFIVQIYFLANWKFRLILFSIGYLFHIVVCCSLILLFCYLCHRLLLKQLVTMEVVQWTALWNDYKDEFENEKNLLGGSLVEKAAEDLKQRIIEHVLYVPFAISLYLFSHVHMVIVIQRIISFQNILVVSKYYSRITLKRIAELLCLSLQVRRYATNLNFHLL